MLRVALDIEDNNLISVGKVGASLYFLKRMGGPQVTSIPIFFKDYDPAAKQAHPAR